ncbi:MAG: hypothetical protein A2096_06695 [Spirochaetes bacterium GWF1_41_5]|nr:MAG: hypothetical protein A2096_06695 [Spirochaetes bacterium GWF1_41_5]HBE01060.1 hypothetical protein [Spirochaetia bacterium]
MPAEKKSSILIVDDIRENIETLSALLGGKYLLKAATSGQAALKILSSGKIPDLILLDIIMPEMDGFEVCEQIKKNPSTKDLPVIFVTASDSIEEITRGFRLGGVDYITKPYNPEELAARVQTHLTIQEQKQKLALLAEKLGRYLSPELYRSFFSGERDAVIRAEKKILTVCFTDIVNFTPLSENMDNETLASWLNSYLTEMAGIVVEFGGTLDKFIGDGIMIFFGDPHTRGNEEDAVQCVSMAKKMTAAAQKRGIQIRAGINSGECRVGNFGSENHMSYSIIGREVNVASRLESNSEPGRILITRSTFDLVKNRIACAERAALKVKGIELPVETFWVN